MSTKTISVNPDFFNIGGGRKKKTRKKLSHSLRTNFNSLQKNILKNKMIDKIKEFKNKKKKKRTMQNNENTSDDYDSAVNFMEEIIQKRKTKKQRKKKKMLEKQKMEQEKMVKTPILSPPSFEKININIPNNTPNDHLNTNIKKDPPYGILKNGNKQLYSKYKQSFNTVSQPMMPKPMIQKPMVPKPMIQQLMVPKPMMQPQNNDIFVFTDKNNFGKQQTTNINRKDKLENLKDNYLTNKLKKEIKKNKNEKFKVKNKKLIKRFILGKNKNTKKVAILIKNKKTRRLINKDCNFLKRKNLKQIKSVLVKNALIKVGTQAPEKLLREMYMSRYLAGDIRNGGGKNAEEILMHNWSK